MFHVKFYVCTASALVNESCTWVRSQVLDAQSLSMVSEPIYFQANLITVCWFHEISSWFKNLISKPQEEDFDPARYRWSMQGQLVVMRHFRASIKEDSNLATGCPRSLSTSFFICIYSIWSLYLLCFETTFIFWRTGKPWGEIRAEETVAFHFCPGSEIRCLPCRCRTFGFAWNWNCETWAKDLSIEQRIRQGKEKSENTEQRRVRWGQISQVTEN